ncbi:hypothetical protein GCM10020254_14610 [Streptomyces goshikiensis]
MADRNSDMFSARMKECEGRPCRNTARLIGRWCAVIDRMTRSPVSGVVAREDDDLDQGIGPVREVVQRQQASDEGEGHPLGQGVVRVRLLVGPVGVLSLLPEHRVAVGQVEQGAGGDPHHQTTGQVVPHEAPR